MSFFLVWQFLQFALFVQRHHKAKLQYWAVAGATSGNTLSAALLPLIATYFKCHPTKIQLSLFTKQKNESQTSYLEWYTHGWQQSRPLNHSLYSEENHMQL